MTPTPLAQVVGDLEEDKAVPLRAHLRRRHLQEGGFIMAMGCAVPADAKFGNVKAMVDSVRERR